MWRERFRERAGVAVAGGRGGISGERAHVDGEAVLLGAIVLHRRPRLGPRPVEVEREAVVEHVEEPDERRIGVVEQPVARVLREMERQRPVRPQHAEEALLQPRGPSRLALLEGRQGRRGEGHRGFLRETHRLLAGAERHPQARQVGRHPLDAPQRLEEVERPRRLGERREQR